VPKSPSPSQSQPQPQPQIKSTPQLAQKKEARKCIENCGLNEYLGSEGSLRIRQEIGKDGKVNPILVQTSGDPELDRKALEAIKNRRYETSESDTTSNIRVTSQQEGSDFTRQQDDRRQRRQIEQDAIARERAIQEQEARKSEPVAEPVVPAPPAPAAEPAAPITPPPASEPIAEPIVQPTPEPVAPQPAAPIIDPESVAPEPVEPVAPLAPEPIVGPAPVTPAPVP
jgi:TonB family protein